MASLASTDDVIGALTAVADGITEAAAVFRGSEVTFTGDDLAEWLTRYAASLVLIAERVYGGES